MKRTSVTLPSVLLAIACLAWPAQAASPDAAPAPERSPDVVLAEQHAAAAFAAYRREAFDEALELYQKAFTAHPSADIVYNIARIYDVGLRQRESAIEHYERYVATPGADPSRIELALRRVRELRAEDESTEPPAVALPERRSSGAERHVPGEAPVRHVTRRASRADADAGPAESGGVSGLGVARLGLWGSGLTALGVGAGFGIAAQRESDAWRRDCDGNACTTQRGVNAATSARQKANVATAALAGGAVLVLAGGVLWLLEGTSSEPERAALRLAPRAARSELGLDISGVW